MSSDINISFAGKEDVPVILEIMESTYRQMKHKDWFCIDDISFLYRHVSDEGFILKAEVCRETAGFLTVRYPGGAEDNLGSYLNLPENEKCLVAHMESAAVKDVFRGRGIQKKLMAEAERILWQKGYRYLMGTAHPENKYSVNNFLKLGYEIISQDLKYGGLPRYVFCRKKNND